MTSFMSETADWVRFNFMHFNEAKIGSGKGTLALLGFIKSLYELCCLLFPFVLGQMKIFASFLDPVP